MWKFVFLSINDLDNTLRFIFFNLFFWIAAFVSFGQKQKLYYWTEAYTRKARFTDTVQIEICEGYPILNGRLSDSGSYHKFILSLGSSSFVRHSLLKSYGYKVGSSRHPDHHKLGPMDLKMSIIMDLHIGRINFEGIDVFIADEALAEILETCQVDGVLGCNFLGAAAWAIHPEKGIAVFSHNLDRIKSPQARLWNGRGKGSLWSPFVWFSWKIAQTKLIIHPEFSINKNPEFFINSQTFQSLQKKGVIICKTDRDCIWMGERRFHNSDSLKVTPSHKNINILRSLGARGDPIFIDLLNRKIYTHN